MQWIFISDEQLSTQPEDAPVLKISDTGSEIAAAMEPQLRDWALTWAFLFRTISNVLASNAPAAEELDAMLAKGDLSDRARELLNRLDVCSCWERPHESLASDVMSPLRKHLSLSSPMHFMRTAALINNVGPDAVLPSEQDDQAEKDFLEPAALSAILAMRSSLSAELYFGRSISDLLADARKGNETALFNAIRADPTVLGCATASRMIQRAGVTGHPTFFTRLTTALTTRLTIEQQHDASLQFFLSLLTKSGFISRLSYKAAQLIFLEVNPPLYLSRDENGPESLARRIRSFKSKRTVLQENPSSV